MKTHMYFVHGALPHPVKPLETSNSHSPKLRLETVLSAIPHQAPGLGAEKGSSQGSQNFWGQYCLQYLCIHMYMYVHIGIFVFFYKYIYMHMCMYLYVYMYINIHIYVITCYTGALG